jgi:zinc D-Ala-D-Ala carboxypeptidase
MLPAACLPLLLSLPLPFAGGEPFFTEEHNCERIRHPEERSDSRIKGEQFMTSHKRKPIRTALIEQGTPSPEHETETGQWSDIKHFVPRDFTCNCEEFCDHPVVISMDLVRKLDAIRDKIGRHIKVLSGTRCERHNRKVVGKLHSPHVAKDGTSHAIDVYCPDSSFRYAFLAAALSLFNRIGIGKDFIHVDDDPDLPPDTMWVYGPDESREAMIAETP